MTLEYIGLILANLGFWIAIINIANRGLEYIVSKAYNTKPDYSVYDDFIILLASLFVTAVLIYLLCSRYFKYEKRESSNRKPK